MENTFEVKIHKVKNKMHSIVNLLKC